MTPLAFTISPETSPDAIVIDKLHERAFGPGRFTRTASRMRETNSDDPRLSFVAKVGTLLVGSIRQTPIKIDDLSGLLLGPLTVEPAFEGKGIGRALIKRSIETATDLGYKLIILVGDAPYYAKAGFKQVPMGKITLSGPVDPARLLYIELEADVMSKIKSGSVAF